MKIYDLTAVFSDELPIYGNDPGIAVKEIYSISQGDRCNLTQYTFGNHTGTHADMPKHFIDNGMTCEAMPLHYFYGSARVLDMRPFLPNRKQVEAADLHPFDIRAGEIILLNMGNLLHMKSSAFTRDYVSLSESAAAYLVKKKIKTVGVDYLSIEASGSETHPVHTLLLSNNIAILEGLFFDGTIPQGRYTLSALPLKFKNGNGSPVRAVLADDFKLELVIFDMDGLILDTEPVSRDGWCEAGKQMGFELGEDLYRRMIGLNRESCKRRMKEYYGYSFDYECAYAIRTEYVHKKRMSDGVAVKKGVHEILDALEANGIKKCVATSTDFSKAKELLTTAGIVNRFEKIIGGDNIKNSKPEPDIFLKAASECGVMPINCLVLEDSEAGAQAAYKANMRVVLVPDLYAPGLDTLAKVNLVCCDLNEAAATFIHQ